MEPVVDAILVDPDPLSFYESPFKVDVLSCVLQECLGLFFNFDCSIRFNTE
jgi:hypothetical protein